MGLTLRVWRHPRPRDVEGRCIGATDVAVDRRRAKRLAHRIRAAARREGHAFVVWTSPLSRCADVGRWLRRFGWRHVIDARLRELDFGDWDGRPWDTIDRRAFDAWCDDLASYAPGAGEPMACLFTRCREVLVELDGADVAIVGHAGWINAWRLIARGEGPPATAAGWPKSPPYATRVTPRREAAPVPNRTSG